MSQLGRGATVLKGVAGRGAVLHPKCIGRPPAIFHVEKPDVDESH